ncbi:MAG: radical SAM protein, partial [Dehalococcoidales bacterium]|nr:radical SAM protein [Dehalococcoidales bacterium]
AQGYREVVLTGVRIGSYCDNGVALVGLLERILAETGVERLRLSSLQPGEVSPEFIALWRDGRLCPHFHLCLQSGSDSILGRMRRRYSTADFEQAVSFIRNMVPGVAITTDVMVGFPGEAGKEFEESYHFCCRMEFARIHVFSYSRRNGTEASRFPDQVGDKVKKERAGRMLALAQESAWSFRRRFLGRTLTVLFEQRSGGAWSGLTANYVKVYAKSSSDLTNRLEPVRLVEIYRDGVWGEIVE